RTGRTRALAAKFDRQTTHVAWARDSPALLFTAEDRGRVGLWRLPVDAGASPSLVVAGGSIGGFAQSTDGSLFAFDRATAQHPPALYACRSDGSKTRAIETLNSA